MLVLPELGERVIHQLMKTSFKKKLNFEIYIADRKATTCI